jgi:hypothetical protein
LRICAPHYGDGPHDKRPHLTHRSASSGWWRSTGAELGCHTHPFRPLEGSSYHAERQGVSYHRCSRSEQDGVHIIKCTKNEQSPLIANKAAPPPPPPIVAAGRSKIRPPEASPACLPPTIHPSNLPRLPHANHTPQQPHVRDITSRHVPNTESLKTTAGHAAAQCALPQQGAPDKRSRTRHRRPGSPQMTATSRDTITQYI